MKFLTSLTLLFFSLNGYSICKNLEKFNGITVNDDEIESICATNADPYINDLNFAPTKPEKSLLKGFSPLMACAIGLDEASSEKNFGRLYNGTMAVTDSDRKEHALIYFSGGTQEVPFPKKDGNYTIMVNKKKVTLKREGSKVVISEPFGTPDGTLEARPFPKERAHNVMTAIAKRKIEKIQGYPNMDKKEEFLTKSALLTCKHTKYSQLAKDKLKTLPNYIDVTALRKRLAVEKAKHQELKKQVNTSNSNIQQ